MNNYIQHAIDTEVFLASTQKETSFGSSWSRIPEGKVNHTLYHGSAGVLLFYIELFLATNRTSYLEACKSAGDELLAYVSKKAVDKAFITIGIYSGWPGYVYSLNELYKLTKDEKYRQGAIAALSRMTAQSSEIGAGIGWIEDIPFSDITGITGTREVIDLSVGAAGAGIIYLYAYRQGLLESPDLAVKTADRLLELAVDTKDGLNWMMMVDMPFPFTSPNFAHGGAGVGYFLADLYQETKKQAYLDAAISTAEYMKSRAVKQSDGVLVCHLEEQQPPRTFYLGICHGPAGSGRLMYLLSEITQKPEYLEWIKDNFHGLLSTGAPEERSTGLWQNHGQCCGDAGIGDYALFLYSSTGDQAYMDYALRIAAHLRAKAKTATGLAWNMAEHRTRPDFLESQTGYMQGAAGIGSFFLHLGSIVNGDPIKLIMPETPFKYAAR